MNLETPLSLVSGPADPASEAPRAATPMMAQYIEIKAANPDCLLFYRMGDFYELFFDDAEVASPGARHHADQARQASRRTTSRCAACRCMRADDYLQKLIALGHRVAVCEQIEDPAEARKRGAKSVVRRDVVRLVTPGTITEDRAARRPAAAISWRRSRATQRRGASACYGAGLDRHLHRRVPRRRNRGRAARSRDRPRRPARGRSLADALFGDPELETVLAELGRRRSTPLPPACSTSSTAAARVAALLRGRDARTASAVSRAPSWRPSAAAIAYVEKTQVGERPPLAPPRREAAGATLLIDPATRANLELRERPSGEPRRARCCAPSTAPSPARGARLLAERLTAPLTDPVAITRRLDAVAFFARRAGLARGLRAACAARRHAARAVAPGAGPRRAARSRVPCAAASKPRDDRRASSAESCELPAELPRQLRRDRRRCRRRSRSRLDRRLPRPAAAQARRRLRARRLSTPSSTRCGRCATTVAPGDRGAAGALCRRDRHPLAEDPPQQRARLLHRGDRTATADDRCSEPPRTRASSIARRWPMRCASPPPNWPSWKPRSPAPPSARWRIELAAFDALMRERSRHADAIRAGAASARRARRRGRAGRRWRAAEGYCRPAVDDSLAFAIEGGRHPVVEQALRRGGRAVRRQRLRPVAATATRARPRSGCSPAPTWAANRPSCARTR